MAARGAGAADRADAAHRRARARSRGHPEWQTRVGAFLQALALLGWTIGHNVRIDTRWGTTNAAEIRRQAAELAALAPDVILAGGTSSRGAIAAGDPHRADRVHARHRSGRRRLRRQLGAAGRERHRFHVIRIQHSREMAGAAQADCAGRDASGGPSRCQPSLCTSQFAAIQAVAPSLGVEVIPVNMRDAGEIERPSRLSRALRMAV